MKLVKNLIKKIDSHLFDKLFQDIISRNTFKNFKLDKKHISDIQRWIFFFEKIHKNNIPGDIVECGVGNGVSLSIICYLKNYYNLNTNIYACDSFKGFPTPNKVDFLKRKHKKKDWSHVNINYVKQNLKNFGILQNQINDVKFISGYFEDTLRNLNLSKISLLHLDCDLYNSYKTCFDNLSKKISPKGIIVLDEYFENNDNNPFPGAVLATNEYLDNSNSKISFINEKGYVFNDK